MSDNLHDMLTFHNIKSKILMLISSRKILVKVKNPVWYKNIDERLLTDLKEKAPLYAGGGRHDKEARKNRIHPWPILLRHNIGGL